LGKGAWRDRIDPGETRFYRVPVGWGQQLFATARVTGQAGGDGGSSGEPALVMALYNPVRGLVAMENAAYQDGTASAVLPSLPPVAYENRYASEPAVSGMRFGGWYYLALSTSSQPTQPTQDGQGAQDSSGGYEVTLDVNLKGSTRPGPNYAGQANPPGTFTVPHQDEQATGGGQPSGGTDSGASMLLLAVTSFSVGGALLLVLALWALLARRRAPRAAAAAPVDPGRDSGAGYVDAPMYGEVPGYGGGTADAQGPEDGGTTGTDTGTSTGTGQRTPGPFGSPGPW
jgi:hypothetical protein